jgi:hypothetical protein
MEDWRMMVARLQPVTLRKSEMEHRLDLLGGGSIDFWSLDNPDASRGRKYKRVTVNEAGVAKNLEYAWNNVIRPCLIDLKGGSMFAFTPKGMNDIYRLEMGAAGDPDWNITHNSSYANPYIPADELDALKKTSPERVFNQEILAEYIADAGMVFRKVMEAAVIDRQIEPCGHDYIVGVDWGKAEDFTVIVVLDLKTKEMVAFDRFNKIGYDFQIGRLMAWIDRYHPVRVYPESNSMGQPLIDVLQGKGVSVEGFATTNATKAKIIEQLSLAFEQGQIKIFNDPNLIAELQAYEVKKTPSGITTYGAPEGMHDDCVMALAIAWNGISPGIFMGSF